MYSPSANHSWCTPRELGPEQSKKVIDRGFSGHRDVEQFEPGGLQTLLRCLVRDRQDVADRFQ